MGQLSRRQVARLRKVCDDLARELDAGDVPETGDAATRAGLDSWLARVISSNGQWDDSALNDLFDLERGAAEDSKASAYVARVIKIVIPFREAQMLRAPLEAVVREHCSKQGYGISNRTPNHPGSLAWSIHVPNREGAVDLSLSGDLFELTFPGGGYLWIEFAYDPEEDREALDELLRVLDAYAHPATRTVTVKHALRRPWTELHLSDGMKMWRRGRTFGGSGRPEA